MRLVEDFLLGITWVRGAFSLRSLLSMETSDMKADEWLHEESPRDTSGLESTCLRKRVTLEACHLMRRMSIRTGGWKSNSSSCVGQTSNARMSGNAGALMEQVKSERLAVS